MFNKLNTGNVTMNSGFELSHLAANPSDVTDNSELKCCGHLLCNGSS